MSPFCGSCVVLEDSARMSFQIPRVYPITDTRISGLSHPGQVERLIEGGATVIQLREKHDPVTDFFQSAQAALAIARKHSVAIIINDRVDIAMALDAAGVHLGQSDMPVEAARRLLPTSIIGISTHDLAQVELAAQLPVDYVAFGPVFATFTKTDREPVVGLDLLRQAKQIVGNLPLIAIGGITADNCLEVLKEGPDSVAVISALVGDATKIVENTRRILELTAV
jgi:thiamine-phosphate pyrophosphorylase